VCYCRGMALLQLGGITLGIALAGVVRGAIRPRYQAWVVRQVQIGRWTQLQAQRFDHRVDMAIWLPVVFMIGMGWGIVIWALP
jgi:hypothetical protein